MTANDLEVGDSIMYQEDPQDAAIQATVLSINIANKIVRFRDWEDFEWDEPFDAIEDVVVKKL